MKISKFLYSIFLILYCSDISCAQECQSIDDLSSELISEIRKEFSELDSLELIFFVKYRVNKNGQINSVWINSMDVLEVNYDKYILSSSGEPLKILYRFYKNENEIRKMIYGKYSNSQTIFCEKSMRNSYFLQPIFVNLKSSNPHSNYNNNIKALSELKSSSSEKIKILPLLIVQRNCKNCL